MNAPILRGLAALALLCLLPRASALTITQTASISASASGVGFAPLQLGTTVVLDPFDQNLGTLTSAKFSTLIAVTASAYEPALFAPFAGQLFIDFQMGHFVSANDALLYSGQPQTIRLAADGLSAPLHGLATFTDSFTHTFEVEITDAAALALLVAAPARLGTSLSARSNTQFGGANAVATATGTVTYAYHVPEFAANTMALMVCALTGLIFARRRVCL